MLLYSLNFCYLQLFQIKMSVQKKPFLKKGTRQFLSNAQVRSQSTKPKIVDFGEDQQEFSKSPALKVRNPQNMDNNDDIKIKIRPSTSKGVPPSKPSQQPRKVDRPPIDRNDRSTELTGTKPKRQSSINKKKDAALSDYLDNESGLNDDYGMKRTSITKPENSLSYKKIQSKKVFDQKKKQQVSGLKNVNLVQQDDDDDEQDFAIPNNDSFKPINNPFRNGGNVPKQSSGKKVITPKAQIKIENKTKKHTYQQSDEQKEEINFVSDKSEDQDDKPYIGVKKTQNKRDHYVEQQEVQPVSKVKMNYFNKNNEKGKPLQQQKIIVSNVKKQLTISDIPKQLRQQIIKQTIAQKEQQLFQELQKLKQKFSVVAREKEKLQEQQRNLMKAKQQFEREMEEKNKQFEQKIKNQNSKLARQKKYMKDAQMSGQVDRKLKNQIEQVKKLLEKEKQDRKKIQSKFKIENQNLRKKLAQQSSTNKLLCQKVKILEQGQVIHKEQHQEIVRQQKKNMIQTQKMPMWADAPQSTYLIRFMQQDFSLIEMNPIRYKYEQNEYYQYYIRIKDNHSPLDSETNDQDRAKRYYKNGKIETEHFQRYLKQTYPFNYSIVYMYNGDIKQVLPQGIVIYYSENSGAIHYTIKNGEVDKQIVYFPSCQTVQMEVKCKDPTKNYTEIYCSGHLKRILSDGTSFLQKKDAKGKVMSMPNNNI